ncbi:MULTISPECIES: 4'-phosphopantetheinyl transferase family protein [Streptosporangium]|uniref:4'-phosphopantetheinyl transferase n=1 Tax=Streptosporangium brasiliense TaxID=47480 RepID=A0ABT9RB07_9ACTN|nr:4'-phosphopantetheinyl transferase superfamily protein [Streptosporangium brasiliense]MDP9866432.1 4'-phosphopantetheinyl transferase [Streptosporangium brasiliense]
MLSGTELERAATFRREPDRLRYLTASWLLRTTAALQLGVPPEDVPVERRCSDCGKPHGKPYIRNEGAELHVSISHSANRVAVALSPAGRLGVDVEEVPSCPVDELVRCALSPAEQEILRTFPDHEQHLAFARMWVCKEAVLKATGHGLRIPPDQVEVSSPRERPALLGWPLDIPPERVQLHPLDPGSGYAGMVAVIADDFPVTVSESDALDLKSIPFSLPAMADMVA